MALPLAKVLPTCNSVLAVLLLGAVDVLKLKPVKEPRLPATVELPVIEAPPEDTVTAPDVREPLGVTVRTLTSLEFLKSSRSPV